MIFIGNQTSFSASPPSLPFDYALANRFDAFEWFPDKKPAAGWDERDLTTELRRAIRTRAQAVGLRLSVHARWQANPLEPDSYPLLWKDLELAQTLGAAVFNIHLCEEQGIPAFVKAILPLAECAAAAGVSLSIENTPLHSPEHFNALFSALRHLRKPAVARIGMCFDLGHANLCAATRNRYLDFVDRLSPEVPIIHLHLHENWGDADTHLPLFTGPSALDDTGIRGLLDRLARRNYSGSIILEQWPEPSSLLDQARNRLLSLIHNPARPEPPGSSSHVASSPSPPREERAGERRSPPSLPSSSSSTTDVAVLSPPESPLVSTPLHPPHDFTAALLTADKQARSWREKLEAVHNLLSQPAPSNPGVSPARQSQTRGADVQSVVSQAPHPSHPSHAVPAPHALHAPATDRLVALAIYLRFLGTGQIPCLEDGRHFRPGHHARLASQIRDLLAALVRPADAFIARKIYPWLPSSAEPFRRAEPLTRIRDIAHRNDIPHDLKKEIKVSLQNKLHRCAGPEDLATSAALLKRITAPGAGFPSAFVEQFKLFHSELKDFFNARSMQERLDALLPKLDSAESAQARALLELKDSPDAARQLKALSSLTTLRQNLRARFDALPADDAQPFLLTDIALEDFAFVLLSELINGWQTPSAGPQPVLQALLLAIENLALSEIEPRECRALSSELRAWLAAFDVSDRDQLLRLKASVERSRRLAETYCDQVLTLFPPSVERIGRALGVPAPALKVFCEADIRGHLVFQLSKLASLLLRFLRERLSLPALDVLVPGTVAGWVKAVPNLGHPAISPAAIIKLDYTESAPARNDADTKPSASQQLLLLLENAAGDEEIPRCVAGIILAHDLPHLSHLAVRARQAGVVLAVCDDPQTFQQLAPLEGRPARLTASPEHAELSPLEEGSTPASGLAVRRPRRSLPAQFAHGLLSAPAGPRSSSPPHALSLDQAAPETCASKAHNLRRLAGLARRDGAGFKTADAMVLPFDVLESALADNPALDAEYRRLSGLVSRQTGARFDALTEQLATALGRLTVHSGIVSVLESHFAPGTRVIVRSSCNCEDLPEMAGAGLCDSVPNVPIENVEPAILQVWSSLWTHRAALSRQQSGIPHEAARMAVVIQAMLVPDFSFVLHTVNPLAGNPREVYAEIAVGLGETLVSGAVRGAPFRLLCHKDSGAVRALAFANFSRALRPGVDGNLQEEIVDYSKISLSRREAARAALGHRLAGLGRLVESAFDGPQDIEGVVVNDDFYLVQTRPQQGLSKLKG